MARRATLLQRRLAASDAPTLVLTGGHEFLPDARQRATQPGASPDSFACKAVREAYSLMPLDASYLSVAENRAFQACGGVPKGGLAVAGKPVVRRLNTGGVRVALILFPALPGDAERPAEETVRAILDAARAANDADLVVGMSPWGFKAEGAALQRLSEGFDVLLGSGVGAPFPLDVTTFAPGVAWSRSDRDGRYVVELAFHSLPGPRAERPREWTKDVDVSAREWPLNQSVPNDQAVFEALSR